MKEVSIEGVISIPDNMTSDQLNDEFIEWLESKGYEFGGMIGDYQAEPEESI